MSMSEPANRYRLDEQVGFLLRQVSQRHQTIFAQRMPDGLTPMQFAALAKLYEVGATSQNRLGRLAAMDAATVKGVIDRLVARGLARPLHDPEDKRRRLLELTPAGVALAERAIPVAAEITEETLGPLDEPARRRLLTLLKKLR